MTGWCAAAALVVTACGRIGVEGPEDEVVDGDFDFTGGERAGPSTVTCAASRIVRST